MDSWKIEKKKKLTSASTRPEKTRLVMLYVRRVLSKSKVLK